MIYLFQSHLVCRHQSQLSSSLVFMSTSNFCEKVSFFSLNWFIYFLQTLGQEYETIVNKKPLSILHSLLLSGFDNRYKLMESYIKAIQLDSVEVIKVVSVYTKLFVATAVLRQVVLRKHISISNNVKRYCG